MYALFQKCIKLKPPSKGWGVKPSVNDTNTADDIERIRFYRNRICHKHHFGMTTQDFNKDALDLIGVRNLIKFRLPPIYLRARISDKGQFE